MGSVPVNRREKMHRHSEEVWNRLMRDMQEGRCIPFLGAGAAAGVLPTAAELKHRLLERFFWLGTPSALHNHPCTTLAQLAQVVELREGRHALTEFLREQLRCPGQPPVLHQALARLPFSVYVTTNYDDCAEAALRAADKRPSLLLPPDRFRRETIVPGEDVDPGFYRLELQFDPSPARPLLFHLHGHIDRSESMVVTELDYFRSLTNFAGGAMLLPAELLSRLARSSILFIGYSLSDWNVRLLFYAIHNRLGHINAALVWTPPGAEEQRTYLAEYLNVFTPAEVFFGNAEDFAAELLDRWARW